jgi:hypothetical protein
VPERKTPTTNTGFEGCLFSVATTIQVNLSRAAIVHRDRLFFKEISHDPEIGRHGVVQGYGSNSCTKLFTKSRAQGIVSAKDSVEAENSTLWKKF